MCTLFSYQALHVFYLFYLQGILEPNICLVCLSNAEVKISQNSAGSIERLQFSYQMVASGYIWCTINGFQQEIMFIFLWLQGFTQWWQGYTLTDHHLQETVTPPTWNLKYNQRQMELTLIARTYEVRRTSLYHITWSAFFILEWTDAGIRIIGGRWKWEELLWKTKNEEN